MIAVSLRFIAGRYHATPWGRHVNEGMVEWPPSPWRILRALVAVWKRTLPEFSQSQVEPIFRALAELPEFILPPASTGHSRHFMPWHENWRADRQYPRTLVFDTFVAVSRELPLRVSWPHESLDDTQRKILARLLANLNRLGRSESWCEAELSDHYENGEFRSYPLRDEIPRDHELVRLLCGCPMKSFADDQVTRIATRIIGRGRNKKPVTTRIGIYDPSWNLCIETTQLHAEGRSDPPGSRWVSYVRPRDCFKIGPPIPRYRSRNSQRVQVVRYALDSTVLPLITETLPVAEAARRGLMGIYGALTQKDGIRGRSQTLSGKSALGEPVRDHRHAYYLATDEDCDGRLDHLTVYAMDGFDADERKALSHLRELRTGRETEARHSLRVLLLGMGAGKHYRAGPLHASKHWVSVTPYIATRFAKIRGPHRIDLGSTSARLNFLRNDIRSMLSAGLPHLAAKDFDVTEIEPLYDAHDVFRIAKRWRPIEFKRFRSKAGDDGGERLSGAFRLTFTRPLQGPIALGFSSHFGMGMFMPETSARLE